MDFFKREMKFQKAKENTSLYVGSSNNRALL
jgi:hypothetical protein